MKKQITRISILQSSKIMTAIYVLLGFIYSLIGLPMAVVGTGKVRVIGIVYCFGPIFMGILGFVFFAIFAALYNVLAKWLGGFEVEVSDPPGEPPAAVKPGDFLTPSRPKELAHRFEKSGADAGFLIERFGEIAGYPLLAMTKPSGKEKPSFYVSAGIHGNEPAPPLALLEMLEAGFFDARANWFLCPILNPTGLAAQTRENKDGVDLNRDYLNPKTTEVRSHVAWLRRQPALDLTICLHEDWESKGFYLYELNATGRPSAAEMLMAAVRKVCAIDESPVIDGRPAEHGIIRASADPRLRDKWPEAFYLRSIHPNSLHYTLESPTAFPMDRRKAALKAAVTAAIG